MLKHNDIYDFFMERLTEIILDEDLQDAGEMKRQLHEIARTAELMHCCIGFREENRQRQRQGLAPLRLEDEFARSDLKTVRVMMRMEED